MTSVDPSAVVSCLRCRHSQVATVALEGRGCELCGAVGQWEPPIEPLPTQAEPPLVEQEPIAMEPEPTGQRGAPYETAARWPSPPLIPTHRQGKSRRGRLVVALVLVVLAIAFLPRLISLTTGVAGSKTPAPTTSSASGIEATLRRGSWVLVLESLPKKGTTSAEASAVAKRVSKKQRTVVVLDSDKVGGLTDGFWVVAAIQFSSKSAAQRACSDFGRRAGGTCYGRQIK